MTGPKLTAMILFGLLAFMVGFAFTIGLNTRFAALITGVVVAALTCTLIHFAKTGKQAFARGFLALGAVFIIVPVAALSGLGDQFTETTLNSIQSGETWSEEETGELIVSSILASAGLVFGIIVGMILVLIGGLMHRTPRVEAQ